MASIAQPEESVVTIVNYRKYENKGNNKTEELLKFCYRQG